MIERKYSKAKAVANHVVWTAREVIPVTYNLDGLVFDSAEFGFFRVQGRDMYCTGFRVDFQVPSQDVATACSVGLYTVRDALAPDGTLALNGIILGATKTFTTPLIMPINSMWKFKVAMITVGGSEDKLPQGITATYYLRYAQGPVSTKFFANDFPEVGVGFDLVGGTLITG